MSTLSDPDEGRFAIANIGYHFDHDHAAKTSHATSTVTLGDGTEVVIDERERVITIASPHVLASEVHVTDPERVEVDAEIEPVHSVRVWRMS
ncbi:hypothetical protein SEA_MACGULLY_5 [Rhodococcus phage MacGully]|nr:hypothetical protein SEA_MACGULLY_5 [Rhodococcus phage MacGully]